MYEQELEILQGTIAAVVYQNYDNGYSVLRVNIGSNQHVTVVGTIPLPCIGERLMVTGKWTTHSSYGKQFEAEFLERMMPQTETEILTYLSGRVIKGIGPKIAQRIVNRFGAETLQIMEREPERLSEVAGITDKRAMEIGEEFRLQVGMRSLMEFFALHHLSAELAVKTYKLYGEAAMDMLYDDPYLLTEDGLDAPFGAVDKFAIELGFSGEDARRVKAGITFELRYNLSAGHSFLPESKLITATSLLLSVGEDVVEQAAERMVESLQLVRAELAGITVMYLPALYEAETYCCERLKEFADCRFPVPTGLAKKLQIAAQEGGVEYSQQQMDAIADAAITGLLLLTGGPGTSKTTIVNGILSLYEQMGLRCLLAAWGAGQKRVTAVVARLRWTQDVCEVSA